MGEVARSAGEGTRYGNVTAIGPTLTLPSPLKGEGKRDEVARQRGLGAAGEFKKRRTQSATRFESFGVFSVDTAASAKSGW